jgi:hypothetical protein
MKILHIITDLSQGGAQKLLFKLIKNDTQNSHVVISLMGYGHYKEIFHEMGIVNYALGMNNSLLDLIKVIRLFKLIKKEKPSHVQTWMYHCDLLGGIVAKLAGIKKIYWGVVAYNLDASVMKFRSRLIIKLNSL